MNFGQLLLKACFPKREKERMDYRYAINYATANAEDLERLLAKHREEINAALKKGNGNGTKP